MGAGLLLTEEIGPTGSLGEARLQDGLSEPGELSPLAFPGWYVFTMAWP